ncbi:sensor histidine kinase [Cellulomonas sp. S1-8]|uniref:sensor histidine kinase n=1 Tax=Cellulomonas sp. S1-8 TaxID=2904790 RepID=UPI0022432AC2|nr:histidine kinase [Cellulomonas sp. S1-8]UZN03029.1 histidine kinase [Cellulomonas sp. S1-8]
MTTNQGGTSADPAAPGGAAGDVPGVGAVDGRVEPGVEPGLEPGDGPGVEPGVEPARGLAGGPVDPTVDGPAVGPAARILVVARGVLQRLVPPPAVVTALLVVAFLGYGLLTGLGAESMYYLTDYLSDTQVSRMATASVVLTLAGATALVWRHRRPVTVAGVVGALAVVSLLAAGGTNGFELAIACALFAVAAARPPRVAWLVAVAVVLPVVVTARLAPLVAVVGTRVLGGDPTDPAARRTAVLPDFLAELLPPSWLVTALPVIVLALLGMAFGSLARTRRLRLAADAEAAAARAAEEAQRARLTQADERARVAREMHDVVAHSITVMVALGAGAAAALDRAPDQARIALDELVETGRTALDDVRRILGVLHAAEDEALGAGAGVGGTSLAGASGSSRGTSGGGPGATSHGAVPMEPQPGVADLARLVERFRTAGLPVRTGGLAVTGLDGLGSTVQLAVYRIVQESLTNALRHAPGTPQVDVDVRRRPDAVEVVVTDQGPGEAVAPSPGTRRGIVGMGERVAAFGGTIEAGPYGQGWRVRALLPQPSGGPLPSEAPLPSEDASSSEAPQSTEGEA